MLTHIVQSSLNHHNQFYYLIIMHLLGHFVKYHRSIEQVSKLLVLGPRAPPGKHNPFPVPEPSSHHPHPGSDRHAAQDE